MKDSVYSFTINLQNYNEWVSVPIPQNDNSRTLHITVLDGSKPYPFDRACVVVARAKVNDEDIERLCVIKNNTVTFDVTSDFVTSLGVVKCTLDIYGADGGRLMTLAGFEINVVETDFPGASSGDEEGSTFYNELASKVDKMYEEADAIKKLGSFWVEQHDVWAEQEVEREKAFDEMQDEYEELVESKVVSHVENKADDIIGGWLDEHPEATTTVQDGSIDEVKLTDDLKVKAIKDYVTPEMFKEKDDEDDTASIQRCVNAIANKESFAYNKQLMFSSGKTYRVTETIDLTPLIPGGLNEREISGYGATIFVDFDGYAFKFSSDSSNKSNVVIKGLIVKGKAAEPTPSLIVVKQSTDGALQYNDGKVYYKYTPLKYIARTPDESSNPKENGWYTFSNVSKFALTKDTEVAAEKPYFVQRVETENNKKVYYYDYVTNFYEGNPSELGYYEISKATYKQTKDTTSEIETYTDDNGYTCLKSTCYFEYVKPSLDPLSAEEREANKSSSAYSLGLYEPSSIQTQNYFTGKGFLVDYCQLVDFEDCSFWYLDTAIYTYDMYYQNVTRCQFANCNLGLVYDGNITACVNNVTIDKCRITNCIAGIYIPGIPNGFRITNNSIEVCDFGICSGSAQRGDGAGLQSSLFISHNYFEYTKKSEFINLSGIDIDIYDKKYVIKYRGAYNTSANITQNYTVGIGNVILGCGKHKLSNNRFVPGFVALDTGNQTKAALIHTDNEDYIECIGRVNTRTRIFTPKNTIRFNNEWNQSKLCRDLRNSKFFVNAIGVNQAITNTDMLHPLYDDSFNPDESSLYPEKTLIKICGENYQCNSCVNDTNSYRRYDDGGNPAYNTIVNLINIAETPNDDKFFVDANTGMLVDYATRSYKGTIYGFEDTTNKAYGLYADIPTAPNEYEIYYATDESTYYMYDGTNWVPI